MLEEARVWGALLKGTVTVAFPYYSLLFLGYHDVRSLHGIRCCVSLTRGPQEMGPVNPRL